MKFVLYCHGSQDEFIRVMRLVLSHGTKLESTKIVNVKMMNKDIDNIYICYDNALYAFNRYDSDFIAAVEQAIATSPYLQYEGPLHVFTKDPRFIDKKYYEITRYEGRTERVVVNKDLIIDDLYNQLHIASG